MERDNRVSLSKMAIRSGIYGIMDPMDGFSRLSSRIRRCSCVGMIRNEGCSMCQIRKIRMMKKRNSATRMTMLAASSVGCWFLRWQGVEIVRT